MSTVKKEVRKLADSLPEDATWDQAMYELYVRQKIAEGEEAVAEGRVVPHEDVKKRFSRARGSPGPSRPSPTSTRSATSSPATRPTTRYGSSNGSSKPPNG